MEDDKVQNLAEQSHALENPVHNFHKEKGLISALLEERGGKQKNIIVGNKMLSIGTPS